MALRRQDFLALGNMHRLPTKSQTRREKAGQRTRKGCEGSCLSPLGNGQHCFKRPKREAKRPTNIWRDFKPYLREIGLIVTIFDFAQSLSLSSSSLLFLFFSLKRHYYAKTARKIFQTRLLHKTGTGNTNLNFSLHPPMSYPKPRNFSSNDGSAKHI